MVVLVIEKDGVLVDGKGMMFYIYDKDSEG